MRSPGFASASTACSKAIVGTVGEVGINEADRSETKREDILGCGKQTLAKSVSTLPAQGQSFLKVFRQRVPHHLLAYRR